MPRCHFLLIVTVTAKMLIYKELSKNAKMRKMLLRIGFVKLLILYLFPKVIKCNNEVKILFMVIMKFIKEYSLREKCR